MGQGGLQIESTTRTSGGVRATARLLVIGVIAAGAFCAPQSAFADPAVEGAWGPLQQYPVVPVSMGVMPDGKIVAWDQANRPPNFGSVPNNGPAMILDPQTGQITRTANIAPRTTFCSLIATLPDGRLAVIGGGSDSGAGAIADVQIYDAASRTFSVLGQMNQRRWYPGGTLDREGNPIVAGGTSAGIERFNQLTGVSTNLDTTFRTNWYPDLVRTPNGNFVIEDVGDNATAGPGRFLLSGTSLTTIADQTLLQARRRGVRTLIGPHTLFYNSGGTSRSSMILDASSGTPQYQLAAESSFPHMTGQALTLPTGEVLVIGGNSTGSDTKGTPVMTPEIYSPSTNSWTSMANIERRRTYHSVAALLPDGRVWSAGSSFDEVQEPNGQFFSPPYLFRDDGSGQPAPRPTATGAPASVAAGQTFTVDTNTPNDIAYASFIRLAATTHQVNAGQAFVQLPVTAQSGRVEMRAPSVDQAPPGYYMVFLVNEDGTPSIAPVVRMYPSPTSTPQPRVVQVSQRDVASPAWNAFDGDAAQGSGAKISRTLDETQPWWEVDFGAPRDIENVRLRLPTTCCDAGNHDVWLIASSQPIQSTDLTTARNQPGVTAVRVQTPAGQYSNLATINRNAPLPADPIDSPGHVARAGRGRARRQPEAHGPADGPGRRSVVHGPRGLHDLGRRGGCGRQRDKGRVLPRHDPGGHRRHRAVLGQRRRGRARQLHAHGQGDRQQRRDHDKRAPLDHGDQPERCHREQGRRHHLSGVGRGAELRGDLNRERRLQIRRARGPGGRGLHADRPRPG